MAAHRKQKPEETSSRGEEVDTAAVAAERRTGGITRRPQRKADLGDAQQQAKTHVSGLLEDVLGHVRHHRSHNAEHVAQDLAHDDLRARAAPPVANVAVERVLVVGYIDVGEASEKHAERPDDLVEAALAEVTPRVAHESEGELQEVKVEAAEPLNADAAAVVAHLAVVGDPNDVLEEVGDLPREVARLGEVLLAQLDVLLQKLVAAHPQPEHVGADRLGAVEVDELGVVVVLAAKHLHEIHGALGCRGKGSVIFGNSSDFLFKPAGRAHSSGGSGARLGFSRRRGLITLGKLAARTVVHEAVRYEATSKRRAAVGPEQRVDQQRRLVPATELVVTLYGVVGSQTAESVAALRRDAATELGENLTETVDGHALSQRRLEPDIDSVGAEVKLAKHPVAELVGRQGLDVHGHAVLARPGAVEAVIRAAELRQAFVPKRVEAHIGHGDGGAPDALATEAPVARAVGHDVAEVVARRVGVHLDFVQLRQARGPVAKREAPLLGETHMRAVAEAPVDVDRQPLDFGPQQQVAQEVLEPRRVQLVDAGAVEQGVNSSVEPLVLVYDVADGGGVGNKRVAHREPAERGEQTEVDEPVGRGSVHDARSLVVHDPGVVVDEVLRAGRRVQHGGIQEQAAPQAADVVLGQEEAEAVVVVHHVEPRVAVEHVVVRAAVQQKAAVGGQGPGQGGPADQAHVRERAVEVERLEDGGRIEQLEAHESGEDVARLGEELGVRQDGAGPRAEVLRAAGAVDQAAIQQRLERLHDAALVVEVVGSVKVPPETPDARALERRGLRLDRPRRHLAAPLPHFHRAGHPGVGQATSQVAQVASAGAQHFGLDRDAMAVPARQEERQAPVEQGGAQQDVLYGFVQEVAVVRRAVGVGRSVQDHRGPLRGLGVGEALAFELGEAAFQQHAVDVVVPPELLDADLPLDCRPVEVFALRPERLGEVERALDGGGVRAGVAFIGAVRA
ncbi:alpha-L-glutamate ligases, RimK family protein [Babesia caballi]|uniref:Alpha-L-glutamate ligases, RimK family protein n=1 Tax=Babesia caballi TaxID=5871 RepID=A0AAV4LUK8_BABCB|nr:alpha-L-glutamate ligases, RimK family protein [Babesia caballi]